MQLLCLGTIALNNRPFRLPAWETPRDFTAGPGARLLFDWARPLPEPLTFSPRRTGPLGRKPEADNGLHKWSPAIVSLADLHLPPARQEAATSTQLMLQQAGFKTLGAGLTPEEAASPLLWGTAEGELTILDWTFSKFAEGGAEGSPNLWPGLLEAGRMIQAVRQTSDWVMVVIHWDDEKFPHPLPAHRELACQLAQLGADIVIGQHPAGVRGMEFVGPRPVFYGLGTFYSSEPQQKDGSEADSTPLHGRSSLGVRFTFQHGRPPVYDLFSFWSDQNEVYLDHAQRAFRRMNSTSLSLHDHPESVYEEWYAQERAHAEKWDRRLHLESLRRDLTRRLRKWA